MEHSQTEITQTIFNTINSLISSLFSSIDSSVYDILDKIVFIDKDILDDNFFLSFIGASNSNGIILLSNSLIIGFVLFYIVRYACSHFMGNQVERPFQFVFRLIVFAILSNCAFFIMGEFLHINYLISEAIKALGENILNCDISFSQLILKLNEIMSESSPNIFSIDGLLKGFISISLLNLLFTYSLRYVILKVFILITPFAFLTLINSSTSWFFKAYFKSILSLLLLQSFISIVLLIIFSINFSSTDLFSKILCIGALYALTKANSYVKELVGGISTEFTTNFNTFRNILR